MTASPPPQTWHSLAAQKRTHQKSLIPASWTLPPTIHTPFTTNSPDLRPLAQSSGILTPRELHITTSFTANTLSRAIIAGEFSAEEVAIAYCKRAAIGQQVLGCLSEIRFAEAIEEARGLDRERERERGGGKFGKGRLHGVVVSVKECFHVKGLDYSNGYISRAFNPSTTTTYALEVLQAAGAIIIAKTNVPQTMLAIETDNNIFGRTLNPVVSHLTCGGSSGGEGSLLAFRGSALGIGTDVAGSIRCPAAANGVYGFKPTCGVLPFIGYAPSGYTGVNTGIPATLGPIASSVRDMILFCDVLREAEPWKVDPAVVPEVWEVETSDRRPVVGFIERSGITPHPPVRRAIREASEKLREAGYEVKEFTPPDFAEIRKVARELLTLDGLSYQKGELAKTGEPPVSSVLNAGFWDLLPKSQEETWALNTKRLAFCKQMLDAWQEAKVDLVLCPVAPHTAVKPGEWNDELYTVAWNAVDYPAVVTPFTIADPALDPKDIDFIPMSEDDALNEAKYDPKLMAGAPVGLQFVGPKWGDAQLLEDMEVIDKILNPN